MHKISHPTTVYNTLNKNTHTFVALLFVPEVREEAGTETGPRFSLL